VSVVLSEHLPLLASAPDGIQKLRGLILELAVRGKLVPQDPNDEPASELLKRIAKKRARLEAEGVCKKAKPLPTVGEDEQPFALPDGWSWSRISDIANAQAGFAFKSSAFNDARIGLPLIRIRDVGFSDPTTYFDGPYREEFVVTAGDYLVSMDGQFRVAEWKGPKALLNQRVSRLQFYTSELAQSFFAISLHMRLAELQGIKAYTTVDHLSGGQISAAVVGVPPLAEQHRIVAKVDELMALCDRLEQEVGAGETAHAKLVETLLGTLTQSTDADDLAANWQRLAEHFDILFTTEASIDALKQTVLQLAVMGKLVPQDPKDEPASELLKRIAKERAKLEAEGKVKKAKPLPPVGVDEQPYGLPNGWMWLKFGAIVDLINGDRSKNYPNREEYVPTGIAWINTGHIEPDGTLTTEGMHFITREKYDSLRSGKIEADDLVYCLRGATFGKTAFVTPYSEGAIASSLVIVRPHLPALKRYLFLYLTSPFGRSQIFRFDNGSAQPNLSANSVTLFSLPLPPLTEQHRIVAKVDELMALCDRLKADLAESRARQARLSATLIESTLQAA
jgi:type I restriction enzyme S subunit